MRQIGTLDIETHARQFSDYLYAQGVKNTIEVGSTGIWTIWVHNEDHLEKAQLWLHTFRGNPDDPEFQGAGQVAWERREQEQHDLKTYRKRLITRKNIFSQGERIGLVTGALIGLCVAVGLLSRLGEDYRVLQYLLISRYIVSAELPWHVGLSEIQHGQVWRLVTPILIHFGFLHLLFNMLWLKDLGGMIERRQQAWTLAALVLGIAAASNVTQFIVSGPLFGGMSGVVYGLLGYAWMRGKYDLNSQLFVPQQTVVMMVIWFFVCLVGLVGNVANTAHGVGFGVGLAWGFLSAKWATRKAFRRNQ